MSPPRHPCPKHGERCSCAKMPALAELCPQAIAMDTPAAARVVMIDVEKVIEAAELCKTAAAKGDGIEAFGYADAVIHICRTELPV